LCDAYVIDIGPNTRLSHFVTVLFTVCQCGDS